ncbi:MAG: hypothetical protein J5824_07165, partial [Lachnospiraceae bacterium]|nr:hypothetical protein [Lachnospiraceae bacterium]
MKKRITGFLVKVLAAALVFAMFSLNAAPVSVQAATKKTVRVATQKELKKALKNSKVGTIVLRTETVDPITITSTKAKKKKLIVDARNSVVTNNAKFKSVTVENAAKYVENVSGNKITLVNNVSIEVTSGKKVKVLTFSNISPWANLNYVVRNGASIGKIAFLEDDGRVTDLGGGSFRIVKSIYEDEELETADYSIDLAFDADGRILKETTARTPKQNDENDSRIYEYEYDERGNLLKLVNSSPSYEYDTYVETYYYDDNNYLTGYSEEYDDRPVCGYDYVYDDHGRMTLCKYVEESTSRKFTYSYDKNGRLVEEKGIYYDLVYGEEGLEEEAARTYTTKTRYNKEGCELEVIYEWGGDADAVKSVVTYEYDKKGNMISYRSEDYYDKDDPSNMNLYRNEYEYDDLG